MKEFLRTALKIVLFVVVLWVLWQVALGMFVGEKTMTCTLAWMAKRWRPTARCIIKAGLWPGWIGWQR